MILTINSLKRNNVGMYKFIVMMMCTVTSYTIYLENRNKIPESIALFNCEPMAVFIIYYSLFVERSSKERYINAFP